MVQCQKLMPSAFKSISERRRKNTKEVLSMTLSVVPFLLDLVQYIVLEVRTSSGIKMYFWFYFSGSLVSKKCAYQPTQRIIQTTFVSTFFEL